MAGLSIPLPTVSESIPLSTSVPPASTVKAECDSARVPAYRRVHVTPSSSRPPCCPLQIRRAWTSQPGGPHQHPDHHRAGSELTTTSIFSGLAVLGLGDCWAQPRASPTTLVSATPWSDAGPIPMAAARGRRVGQMSDFKSRRQRLVGSM